MKTTVYPVILMPFPCKSSRKVPGFPNFLDSFPVWNSRKIQSFRANMDVSPYNITNSWTLHELRTNGRFNSKVKKITVLSLGDSIIAELFLFVHEDESTAQEFSNAKIHTASNMQTTAKIQELLDMLTVDESDPFITFLNFCQSLTQFPLCTFR